MKRFVFTLALACFFGLFASAQVAMSPDTVALQMADSLPSIGEFVDIKNSAPFEVQFKWERTILQISNDCVTQVCDLLNCYPSGTSTKTFKMAAGQEGTMQMHFLKPEGVACCAVALLKVWEVANPANTATTTWLVNDCAVVLDANDVNANINVRMFPNPATEFFTLENAVNIGTVRLFATDGREVKRFENDGDSFFQIADLPVGNYYVTLQDKAGQVVKVLDLAKQ